MTPLRFLCGIATMAVLTGCTSDGAFSVKDAGFDMVGAKTSVLGKETVWVQSRAQAQETDARVKVLLTGSKTLNVETAVQVALLNNRGLQAAYADLGEAGANVWQSTLFSNPTASIGLSGIGTPGLAAYRAIEGTLAVNLLALFTREAKIKEAKLRFEQAQLNAALKTLTLAAGTRRAWINAVAARESVIRLGQAQITADAASELAEELGKAGSMTKAAQAREHAFNAELAGQAAQARLAERLAKEELTRLMGIWGADAVYRLPNTLPSLPKKRTTSDLIEAEALAHRVDLQIARLELAAAASAYGLTDATRLVTDFEIISGFETEREKDDGKIQKETTYSKELEFVIPIFDSGKARLRKAELAYMRAANLLAEKAVNVRSEARSAYEAYRSSYDIARHYRNSLVPLRTTIEQQSLLTYNGMITNTFELLADTRDKVSAQQLSINAKRDFWLAAANLTAAIYGGGAGAATAEVTAATPANSGGGH